MREQKIIRRPPILNGDELPDDLHPVLRRILIARHVNTIKSLDYSLKNLLPYTHLQGIEAAVNLLYQALTTQARILIVADYDADGATSCAVAVKGLRQMGLQQIGYLVPNREKQGYGLTPEIVEFALKDSLLAQPKLKLIPDLLVTVDNGIASIAGVQLAKQCGLQVLITDHHSPAKQLPPADAIVNPNQPGDTFPSKHLAGVGVIFYILLALRARLRQWGWLTAQNIPDPPLAELLDLVALGTVADVVALDYNNRILVEQGLRRMRADHCCAGIRALIQIANRDQSNLITEDLAFFLGPRLNAAGRMDDMSYGIACLLSENDGEALEYAQILDNFNHERRFVEAGMQQEALEIINEEIVNNHQELSTGLCLFNEHWHQGVVGIIAGRLKDRFHRPVIVFAKADEYTLRGSARSVLGVHIRDVLDSIATQYPEIISQFGGHAMAAGLSLPIAHLEKFQQIFNEEVSKHLSPEDLQGTIFTDGELTDHDFNLNLAEQLRTLTPWGQNFPEPLFDGPFELLECQILKEKHLKMKVRPLGGNSSLSAIAFNADLSLCREQQVHLVYKLDVNLFRGHKNIQLVTKHIISKI